MYEPLSKRENASLNSVQQVAISSSTIFQTDLRTRNLLCMIPTQRIQLASPPQIRNAAYLRTRHRSATFRTRCVGHSPVDQPWDGSTRGASGTGDAIKCVYISCTRGSSRGISRRLIRPWRFPCLLGYLWLARGTPVITKIYAH
jgi:hypothetical protein